MPQRQGTLIVGTFGATGLVVAMTGLYGVLAYTAAQRRREFGVRMALDVPGASVVRLVVRDGLVLTGLGIALGLVGAFAAGRAVSSVLCGVSSADPITFVVVPCFSDSRRPWRAQSARDGPARARDLDLGVLAVRGPVDVVALTNAFTRALGVQAVDVTDLRRADSLPLALAARDGVALYEGEPGAHARFASLALRRFYDTQKFRDAERDYIHAFIAATASPRLGFVRRRRGTRLTAG